MSRFPPVEMSQDNVIYCDNHLLVVNKPAGMLTQGDRTGDQDLLSWARRYIERRFDKPGRAFIGLVHRLDRPASGVVIFARTSKAAARLSRQFREREVTKRYLALVEGHPAARGTLRDHVREKGTGIIAVAPDAADARPADLNWRVVGKTRDRCLVEIQLITGRKHQIRFQMANSGYPVVGDFRYGATTELDGRNLALHAYYLAVTHPTKGERLWWTSAPPETWGAFGGDAGLEKVAAASSP